MSGERVSPNLAPDGRLPVSAIVVTFNEVRRLRECLAGLAFCDQVIVVDLGSTDDSVRVARECGAEVHRHERMPIVEMILPRVQHLARNPWRMRLDPDEVLDPRLLPEVAEQMARTEPGIIRLPYQYHFKGRPLDTTAWGGVRHQTVFYHKDRTLLRPLVHVGITCREGFVVADADAGGRYPVRHYWVDGYAQLWEKHRRYLREEGRTRVDLGDHFSWPDLALVTLRSLGHGLVVKRGWRGGWAGWGLSFFYAWYTGMSKLALRARMRAREGAPPVL